jgi:retron-type reverse transcriptase
MALPAKLIAIDNLELAFDRVIRAQNRDYKAYFRHLCPSYQLALHENLQDLATDLRTGRYEPSRATCIFQPKKSGILRPLTLLGLTDQIVYQAIINLVANASRADQKKYAFKWSFGAILTDKTSLFFYRSWKRCYRKFDAVILTRFLRRTATDRDPNEVA